jgi:hypothetical protein
MNPKASSAETHLARRARTAAAVFVTAAMAVLAVACTGSSKSAGVAGLASSTRLGGSPSAGGSSTAASALAYSSCMRSHGVLNYPDPASDGQLPKGDAQAFGVSTAQYQAAQTTCQPLLPKNDSASLTQCLLTGDCPPDVVQQALNEGRTFAQCMRNHGVQNWPDPTIDSTGRPSFQVVRAGISIDDTRSSQMLSKIGFCESQPGAELLRQE